jgi:hypothetical protein
MLKKGRAHMKNSLTRLFAAGFVAASLCAAPRVFFPTGIDVPAVLGNQKLAQLGLVDVTAKPFQADPTGQRDSTDALQKAIEFSRDKRMVAFFPLGTYRVSGTLTAVKSVDRMYPCLLVGEKRQGRAARPVILLAPHSPGFSDPAHPKYVVNFWSRGYGSDLTKSKPGENINQMLVGIDVTIGEGNSGAVGVSCNAAQGSGIQDSTIDATHGFSGIEGGAGSGGSHVGVTVIGGRYGLDLRDERSNMVPTLTGITLIGQTEAAILTNSQTLVAVGVKIVSKAAGPLIVISNGQGMPCDGQMCLVDSEIVFEKPSAKNVAITSWRSLYLNNVFVKNAAKLVANPDGSELAANPSGWMRIGEYAHGVRPPLYKEKYQYEAPVYIDGVRSSKDVIEGVEKGQGPPADLGSRHLWGPDFPSWQSPGAVNVKAAPYNAKGDSQTDDSAALQRAIDENEIVFLPKGLYRVTRTIRLKPNTKLVGVGQHLSMLLARGQSGDFSDVAHPKPMILTADDRNAPTVMSFCGVGTMEDAIGAYPLNWRAGRNSILCTVMFKMPNPENPGRNSPYVLVSDHGGGRWYNFYAEFFTKEGPEYRHLLVDGTSEPLRFYQCNPEHARSNADMEIRNSRYVTIYGLKGEGNYPELLVRDSDHVRVFGYGGNAAAYEHTSLFRIERTPNFLIANAVAFPRLAGVGSDEHYAGRGVNPNLWYMIGEAPAGGAEIKTAPLDRPVLYRRGAPRGAPAQ